MRKTLWIIALLALTVSCVDRINFDPPLPAAFPVVFDGFITDQPGPYEISISKAFDVQSKQVIKQMVNVKSISISDNVGNTDELIRIRDGVYITQSIQGQVGRAYSLKAELLDGRVYESDPDTLNPGGTVDSVYHTFESHVGSEGETDYGFNVLFNSTAGNQEHFQFLWNFIGTYEISTNPEKYTEPCGETQCPRPLPCSSYRLSPQTGELEYFQPCQCCDCWVNIFNDIPVVSDDQLIKQGRFTNIQGGYVPLTQWTFMYRVHVEIQQLSLSPRAFDFWRSIKAQKLAISSLFQPLTGQIPTNFHQLSGPEGPVEGFFYASSVTKKSTFIDRKDVPNEGLIPKRDLPFTQSCLNFPYSTNVQPDFWK